MLAPIISSLDEIYCSCSFTWFNGVKSSSDVEQRRVFHPDASGFGEGAHVDDLGHEGAVETLDAAFQSRLPETSQEKVKRLEGLV